MVHALMYQTAGSCSKDRLVHDGTGLHCCTDSNSAPYPGGVQHQTCPASDNLCAWLMNTSHNVRLPNMSSMCRTFVACKNLPPHVSQEDEPQLLITIPPNTAPIQNAHAIRIIQVGPAAAVCPANRYLTAICWSDWLTALPEHCLAL